MQLPAYRLLTREETARASSLCWSVFLLLSPVHLNCAVTAKSFARDDNTRIFWLRLLRKDAYLALSSGYVYCSASSAIEDEMNIETKSFHQRAVR